MGVTSTTKARASTQARATIETKIGRITQVYKNPEGNVIAGDVLIQGEQTSMVGLTNSSGSKFNLHDNVVVNFPRGQPLAGQIVGFASGESSAAAQASAETQTGTITKVPADISVIPVVLAGPDETAPDGYVEQAGANIVLSYNDPGTVSGNINGLITVSAKTTVATALPNPATTALPSGTLLDLTDGAGNPLGMYRLDTSGGSAHWRRRDAAGTATSSIVIITLADYVITVPTPGRSYYLSADFSSLGVFADVCFQPVLITDHPLAVVAPNYNGWTGGVAAWTLYLPIDTAGYGPSTVTLSTTIAGRGWTGSGTTGLAALWSGPNLIN